MTRTPSTVLRFPFAYRTARSEARIICKIDITPFRRVATAWVCAGPSLSRALGGVESRPCYTTDGASLPHPPHGLASPGKNMFNERTVAQQKEGSSPVCYHTIESIPPPRKKKSKNTQSRRALPIFKHLSPSAAPS